MQGNRNKSVTLIKSSEGQSLLLSPLQKFRSLKIYLNCAFVYGWNGVKRQDSKLDHDDSYFNKSFDYPPEIRRSCFGLLNKNKNTTFIHNIKKELALSYSLILR